MYTAKSFENLQFNPMVDGAIWKKYPVLLEILSPELVAKPDTDFLLRYIIMVYDPKSILVFSEKDLNYRKGIAAELAQLNVEDEQYIQDIYSFVNETVVDLVIRFLVRFIRSKEWAAICAFETKFWESIKKVIEPISGKNSKEELESVQKKAAISDEIDKDIKRLDNYYKEFFGNDAELEQAFKMQRYTPETAAKLKRSA